MSPLRSLASLFVTSALVLACEWRIAGNDHGGGGDPSGSTSTPPSSSAPACGRAGETTTCTNAPLPASCTVDVDRAKELLVIHRSVLLDKRAQNNLAGAAWSFRSRMEDLSSASGSAADAFTVNWLDQWRTVTSVGDDYAPVTPRPKVGSFLIAPWRAKGGSLADAPFRLIAIVNRPDLRHQDDGCAGAGGELRFVYSAVDMATGKSAAMTVIIEIPYPATRTARGWIDAWHTLGQLPFGAEYNAALEAITTEAATKSSKTTWRIRTNEIALAEGSAPWEMREFAVKTEGGGMGGPLVQIPMASTPRIELDRSASLDSWAKENEAKIRDGSYVLPGGFQAGAAPMSSSQFRWSTQKLDSELREKLSLSTCNGCHAGERRSETSLPFQHIAAADQPTAYYGSPRDGETRISRWLEEDLENRETSMARALCSAACTTPQPAADAGASEEPYRP